ncbi:uncharacterized protein LOC117175970 [Belonocnema kinseyi]|uniref:uncharacterized protein LOC117175970 n=1 Tax=Belonocnema kinseyi TaxID=2817044 RepID=UPI00143CF27F|nr:uncharacterized protein LOC117175970 [Belonocnema kinseyi]
MGNLPSTRISESPPFFNTGADYTGPFSVKDRNGRGCKIANTGIQWHFIPAYTPHFGGNWERGVKSGKHYLKRVAGEAILTFEEFATLLTQIEAILNSRPLTPLSSDPNYLSPIIPANFLIGRTFSSLAYPDLSHVSQGRLSNWQRIQQLQQHL